MVLKETKRKYLELQTIQINAHRSLFDEVQWIRSVSIEKKREILSNEIENEIIFFLPECKLTIQSMLAWLSINTPQEDQIES
jgi:hypothetical protein